ncbi:MAG: right-handed parallel beta-helix repeat-containing protein [Anaerolineae bacterium]|nr:right-handed parallel beta-helix repeat-containing protein [Anaerolineae bacterium]
MNHKSILKCLMMWTGLIALALSAPQVVQACGGGVICVDGDAPGAATGLTWTDAFTNVQDALAGAVYGDEIWVAEGVYYPDLGAGQTDDSVNATFTLRPGVALYGGFAATETLRTQRDWVAHVTVLSGDIDGNDLTDAHGVVTDTDNIAGDNAYHVTTGGGVTETARLDGFSITAGDAGPGDGGGMHNVSSNPMLSNIAFRGNRASYGSGMYNTQSSPSLTDIIFDGNQSDWHDGAGGIHNENRSNPTLNGVTFSNNSVTAMVNEDSAPTLFNVTFKDNEGCGMINDYSNPVLTNVIFTGNQSDGGMGNNHSNPTLINVEFSNNNTTYYGGGMYNYLSSPTLISVTFSNNQAEENGGGMYNISSNPALKNVTFDGNSVTGNYSSGGGMYNDQSHPTLENVSFNNNQAPGRWGGGVYNSNHSSVILTNTTFSNNVADYGGGIYNDSSCSISLTTALLNGNQGDGSGVYNDGIAAFTEVTFSNHTSEYGYGGSVYNTGTAVFTNVIFSHNRTEFEGGGVYNTGNAVFTGVTFNANEGGTGGGGLYNYGNATLINSAFSANISGYGGGLQNAGNATLILVTFDSNLADNGGGIFSEEQITLTDVTFSNNRANYGGGMYNVGYVAALTDVNFTNNHAEVEGGGMSIQSNSTQNRLNNVIFSGNSANTGGGMNVLDSEPALTNVIFSGNRAEYGPGGGMSNYQSTPTLINVTFAGNRAGSSGGGLYNDQSSPTLINCILWGNDAPSGPQLHNGAGSAPGVTFSDVQWSAGVYTGTGNLNRDPQFVAPISASAAPTTGGDYRLNGDSPVIDAGDPATCPATDLRGEPRDDLRCDMGAYEFGPGDGDTVVKADFAAGVPYSFGPTRAGVTFSGANGGAVTVTKHLEYPGGTQDSGELPVTWWIDADLASGFPVTLSLCYTGAEVEGLDELALHAFRWDGADWTTPISAGLTVFTDTNCVQITGIEEFSAWTLKDISRGADTPTAITLSDFGAYGGLWGGVLLLAFGVPFILQRKKESRK